MLTIRDVAERLNVSQEVVLTHVRAGRLKAANVGLGSARPRWRISEDDLDAFLASRAVFVAPKQRRRRVETGGIEFF